MQIIRLVNPGRVDRVIGFDSLPKMILRGIKAKEAIGAPRHFAKWLEDVGSVTTVSRWNGEERISYEVTVPCFFEIDYITVNSHKEKWQEIVNYVRRVCDPSIRLLDKFEDMAKPLAPDSYQSWELEPEDVPVIPLLKKDVPVESDTYVEKVVEKKKRGRPPKLKEEVLQT